MPYHYCPVNVADCGERVFGDMATSRSRGYRGRNPEMFSVWGREQVPLVQLRGNISFLHKCFELRDRRYAS